MNHITSMTRDEIIAKLRETAPALKDKGVTYLAIFGSRARGVERLIKEATGLETYAEMRRSLEPRFAERIADDIIEVF